MILFDLATDSPRKEKDLDKLIVSLSRGDMEAFQELYLRTKSSVYGYALSIVKSVEDAEDVMQETYLRVYNSSPNYQPKKKALNWILTITRNLSFNKLNLKSSTELPLEEGWLSPIDDFTENSLDKLTLKLALKELSLEERQIVILYSVAGLKHREIATLLDIPLTTELSKYQRSLNKLKRKLEETSV